MKYDPVKHDMKMREREKDRVRSFKFPPFHHPYKPPRNFLVYLELHLQNTKSLGTFCFSEMPHVISFFPLVRGSMGKFLKNKNKNSFFFQIPTGYLGIMEFFYKKIASIFTAKVNQHPQMGPSPLLVRPHSADNIKPKKCSIWTLV
jgi:hypothetical protein